MCVCFFPNSIYIALYHVSSTVIRKNRNIYIYIHIGSLQVDFRVEQCSIR